VSWLTFLIQPPITFNDSLFTRVEVTDDAQKHYGDKSEAIFGYIAGTLNGQRRRPEPKPDAEGNLRYGLASLAVGLVSYGLATSDFRDTVFLAFPDRQTIRFVHGSPRRPEQYGRFPPDWKERQE
jgi:hypothetical protein